MEKSLLLGIEQNRKRLEYYFQLKEKAGSKAPSSLDKWIEIYSERMRKLENQVQELDLDDSFTSNKSTLVLNS